MRGMGLLDFSSWSAIAGTVICLLVMTMMMMGVRLLFMQIVQKRRERENRQINERLRTLIAAYKVLGGSFTGNLTVSPTHLRDARAVQAEGGDAAPEPVPLDEDDDTPAEGGSSERQRRTRDAVEAVLSDIILLGTEEQVRMAAQAAQDMVQGRPVQTAQLVVSLRQYIRQALYLEAIPADIAVPSQGPQRPGAQGGSGNRRGGESTGRNGRAGGGSSGGGGSGMALGLGLNARSGDERV